jgi:hypothetical protein
LKEKKIDTKKKEKDFLAKRSFFSYSSDFPNGFPLISIRREVKSKTRTNRVCWCVVRSVCKNVLHFVRPFPYFEGNNSTTMVEDDVFINETPENLFFGRDNRGDMCLPQNISGTWERSDIF